MPASVGLSFSNACSDKPSKIINDVLWKDAGCRSDLDCTEQTLWLLLLKYLMLKSKEETTGVEEVITESMLAVIEIA